MTQAEASQVAVLTAMVTAMAARAEEDRAERRTYEGEAARDRHETLSIVRAQENALTRLGERMGAVEPVVKMITSLQARVTGGLLVLGFIGAVAWGGITFFHEAVVKWFSG